MLTIVKGSTLQNRCELRTEGSESKIATRTVFITALGFSVGVGMRAKKKKKTDFRPGGKRHVVYRNRKILGFVGSAGSKTVTKAKQQMIKGWIVQLLEWVIRFLSC